MLCNKLVLIAVTAALALSSISASQQSTVHLRVHSQSKGGTVYSGPGQSPMSVEGIEGVYCVTGQPCVADVSNGTCPGVEPRLPYGSVCGKVKTGVYGCKPLCTDGEKVTPMSVEGVDGVFCVPGTACAGQDGVCPDPQGRLEHGSGADPHKHHKSHKNHKNHDNDHDRSQSKAAVCSAPGQSPISVEGVFCVFCVSGPACVANVSTGACPGPQPSLPNGAVCGKVKSGVFGCKPVVSGGGNTESDSENATESDSEDSEESFDERRRL